MPGKIMVSGEVFLDGVKSDDAIIFIHVKGYGRARVTHIDIESMAFKKILLPRHDIQNIKFIFNSFIII